MAVKNAIRFLREVKVEFSKVLWPSFDEFIGSSLVVFVLVCIFAVYLGSIDFLLSKLANYIFQYGTYSA